MTGWLVVNSFLNSGKFFELYGFLQNSAKALGIDLDLKQTDSLLSEISDDFDEFQLPNFVLFWDKDVYLARRLEQCGVKVFNSSSAIEICDNKLLTALKLNKKVKMPKTVFAPKTFETVGFCKLDFLKKAIEILGLPLVIKEAFGSFGQQVYLANSLAEAEKIVQKIWWKDFLMQEFVSSSFGTDVRVNVVGGKVVASMLRENANDFRSNITNGGKMKKVEISHDMAQIAVTACREIGLDFAGVDVLFGKDNQPVLCEVNSNPHFKSTLDCTGVDLSREILKHILTKL